MKQLHFCRYWIVALLILAFVLQPDSVNAQESVSISENGISYEFGVSLQISGRIDSYAGVKTVHVILNPEGQTSRQVKLIPSADGSFEFNYDLSQDPLKPFSRIYYWYQVESLDGSLQTSPSFWFDYIDNRYPWKHLSSKLFDVYWTGEDASFGQLIMDIATSGLERATQILPVAPELPISIYLYPNVTALQDTLSLAHQSWIAGHASPELGVILVSDGTDQTSRIELERNIPHELMHILQYQVAGSAYINAPAWLLEGLAMLAQPYPNPDDDRILTAAVKSNALIPLEDMCAAMPIAANETVIGYAQSLKVVQYLQEHFSSQVLLNMLQSSTTGISCSQNLKNNTGLSHQQLLADWLAEAYPGSQPSSSNYQLILILGGCGLLILIAIIVREILRKRARKE